MTQTPEAPSQNTTALAKIGDTTFAVLARPFDRVREVIKANLGDQMRTFDLDRVPMPAGGGLAWTVPTLRGPKSMDSIVGVIVAYQDVRVYWKQKYDGTKTPPDCTSDDCQIGHGAPGGDCRRCPFAAFKSAADGGAGQACKQCRRLLIVVPDQVLPIMLSLPPTSLLEGRKYLQRLAGNLIPYYAVVTKIGLQQDKNSTGLQYSKVKLEPGDLLSPEQEAFFVKFHEALVTMLARVPASAADYAGGEEAPPVGGAVADPPPPETATAPPAASQTAPPATDPTAEELAEQDARVPY